MYKPQKLTSDNSKTYVSINLPIKGHCTPTPRCAHDCYARTGHIAYPNSIRKQDYVSNYLKGENITQLIVECRQYSAMRLSGSGDLLPAHVKNIISLAEACPQTQFWGMTRKPNISIALNDKLPNLRILVTVDPTSPDWVWKYAGKLCFGPRRVGDTVPDDPRIITVFPRHHHGKIVGKVPDHPKDCLAVRHLITGCVECGRCWNWNEEMNIPIARKIEWSWE